MSIDEPSTAIGCKWRIYTLNEGVIEGFLRKLIFNSGIRELEFDNVEVLYPFDGGTEKCIGSLRLFRHDIKLAKIIDESPGNKKLFERRVPLAFKAFEFKQRVNVDSDKSEVRCQIGFSSSSQKEHNMNDDVIAIYSVDDYYYKSALNDIINTETIGVAAFGENVSRYGFVEYILISTKKANYVFTENALYDRNNEISLKQAFESPKIVKIVHGGRFLADALKNKYQIEWENTKDTQIIDLFVRENLRKSFPKDLRSYEHCVKCYLDTIIPGDISFTSLKIVPLSLTAQSFVRTMVLPLKRLYLILMHKKHEKLDNAIDSFHRVYSEANAILYESLKKDESNIYFYLQRSHRMLENELPYCEDCFESKASCFEKSAKTKSLIAQREVISNGHHQSNGHLGNDLLQRTSNEMRQLADGVNGSISRGEPSSVTINGSHSDATNSTHCRNILITTISLSSDDLQDPLSTVVAESGEYRSTFTDGRGY